MTTTSKRQSSSENDPVTPYFRTLNVNPTSDLSSESKLPPIGPIPPFSSSDHQRSRADDPIDEPNRHTPGLCGLKNMGNTCYMNSAIQCLNSIPDIAEWIMKQPTPLSHTNIIDVYISLVQSMWSGRHACVTPHKLKQYVSRSAFIFSDDGQKDAHELMNSFLNAIEAVDSNSFLVNLFRIHTKSKVTCNECQHVDITDEKLTFLPLPVPEIKSLNYKKVLLEDLIKDFCQEDELEGQYYCQQCQMCQSGRHRTIIDRPLPRALIIQLKRFPFDGTYRKINTLVQYEHEHRNLLSDNDRYELRAVSMHSGSLAGGHYMTVAKNYKMNKWYRFNDDDVEEINFQDILKSYYAQQSYVLVYLKQES